LKGSVPGPEGKLVTIKPVRLNGINILMRKHMSKQLTIHSSSGSSLGQIDLNDDVFGIEPNIHVMHLALRRQLNNSRAGTACTKTKGEVRGGGRKPWKQKGTGRARAGSIRSPLFVGGGVIFGPKPRDYAFSMPQKARKLALRSACSARSTDIYRCKTSPKVKLQTTKEFSNVVKELK
jgi:large subunit ribosomal protein L4